MNDTQLTTLPQVTQFLAGTEAVTFQPVSKDQIYAWIEQMLHRFGYHRLRKGDKSEVVKYMLKVTNYSRQQLVRLIKHHRRTGSCSTRRKPRHAFSCRYTREDILLLAKVDEWHQTLSGPATKKICERAFYVYKEKAFENLACISTGHLYNLRKTYLYDQQRRYFTKTRKSKVAIGIRRKPRPNGRPGFIRIDTVHQGDEDKRKGIYHVNAVDEVTQFEIVVTVEKITEVYLIPALAFLLDQFPFIIKEFHADNGSEYINHQVARLLNKLLIEMTKSRPRHSNDNALVESKNGSIVRKYFGYSHISQKWAPAINKFNQEYLNPYLNFHRPCFFAVTVIDNKGKQKKTYPYEQISTPYDKLRLLPHAPQYLKPGVSFNDLDKLAQSLTDNQAAEHLQEARRKLFNQIFEQKKQRHAFENMA
jgi:transposase InsO family protein